MVQTRSVRPDAIAWRFPDGFLHDTEGDFGNVGAELGGLLGHRGIYCLSLPPNHIHVIMAKGRETTDQRRHTRKNAS